MGDGHFRQTYNDIHLLIQGASEHIRTEFNPDLMIAIGGGGFIPARIARSFLKTGDGQGKKNIPIQAIGLSLYEALPDTTAETIGTEVIRTQWLDFSTLGNNLTHGGLLGRRILIVDEVDDSRKTLSYAVKELMSDVEASLNALQESDEVKDRLRRETQFGVFVVHNKLKPKAAEIPGEVKYFSGLDIEDVWVDYPWEMTDILKHDELKRQDDEEAKAKKA